MALWPIIIVFSMPSNFIISLLMLPIPPFLYLNIICMWSCAGSRGCHNSCVYVVLPSSPSILKASTGGSVGKYSFCTSIVWICSSVSPTRPEHAMMSSTASSIPLGALGAKHSLWFIGFDFLHLNPVLKDKLNGSISTEMLEIRSIDGFTIPTRWSSA